MNALGAGVRPLVELAGEVLHCKHLVRLRQRGVDYIHLRLGEHDGQAAPEERLVNALDVVAVQKPEPREARDSQKRAQLGEQALGLDVIRRFFSTYTL